MGTVIETQNDTERLLDNTHDSVKLTLDTGHMLFAKGDSQKILENYKEDFTCSLQRHKKTCS